MTLAVKSRIAPSWHIYAINKPTDVQIPTSLKLSLPDGVEEVGEWDIPESHPINPTTYAYDNEVTFRRLLKVSDSAAPGLKR